MIDLFFLKTKQIFWESLSHRITKEFLALCLVFDFLVLLSSFYLPFGHLSSFKILARVSVRQNINIICRIFISLPEREQNGLNSFLNIDYGTSALRACKNFTRFLMRIPSSYAIHMLLAKAETEASKRGKNKRKKGMDAILKLRCRNWKRLEKAEEKRLSKRKLSFPCANWTFSSLFAFYHYYSDCSHHFIHFSRTMQKPFRAQTNYYLIFSPRFICEHNFRFIFSTARNPRSPKTCSKT